MKRASASYRLQLIKEVVTRREREAAQNDPMASHIQQMLQEKPDCERDAELNHRFQGSHFDEHAGGWVSDEWGLK